MKAIAAFCYLAALAAIVYIATSGERWPLSFVAVMVLGGTGLGLIEHIADRLERDR